MRKERDRIQNWIKGFVEIGHQFAKLSKSNTEKKFTLALCLPRIEYAALTICLGILKERYSYEPPASDEIRLKKLVGQWVTYETKNDKTIVGILEYDEDSQYFKVRHYKKTPNRSTAQKLGYSNARWHILSSPTQFPNIQPAGRDFNETRPVTQREIDSIISQNQSMIAIGEMIGSNLENMGLSTDEAPPVILGFKQRLQEELSTPIFPTEALRLEQILKPSPIEAFENSSNCVIQTNRDPVPNGDKGYLLVEANRNLPDILAYSRSWSRIIILGRNMPAYEEAAHSVLEEYSIGSTHTPLPLPSPPDPVAPLLFSQK